MRASSGHFALLVQLSVRTLRINCRLNVLLHFGKTIPDELLRQALGGDVQALLVGSHAFILMGSLGQGPILDLIPEAEVKGHPTWTVWGELP